MAIRWASFMNRSYINIAAPKIKVFKLDKTVTNVDTLYGEENTSRIYLPPIEMRAFMLTNKWRQLLNLEAYKEEEDNMDFIVNFEDMVQKIRDKKNGHTSEIHITYNGLGVPSASKQGNTFTLKIDDSIQVSYNLNNTSYNTVQKLATNINAIGYYTLKLVGINDSSINLVDFEETSYKNNTLLLYSQESYYDNITDVIELGDLILTNKFRLYEVFNANPSGDFGWDWVTYTLSCNLARIDTVNLPSNYNEQIRRNQYGIADKINME